MQGFERSDGDLLDTAVGQLVPAGSMFAFLAAHRAEVFPDADYADLFAPPGVGRPSLPATRMAAVLTLHVLHDYSDRETAEAVRFDVRWKVAAGVPLDDPGFDPVGLDYWIWPVRAFWLGSSLSDHFGPLPACTLSAQLPDGAGTAPGVQGRRTPGAPARERGLAPPDRPGPLRASRPAMAGGTVAIGSPSAVGRGVHGDPGDAARLAPAADRT